MKNAIPCERFLRTFAAMFNRLQQKWKVSGLQLTLILCTFAIGGSLTGIAAKKIMPLLGIDKGVLWVIIYIILLTLIWPMAVLLISIPFGQFRFFTRYLKKMGRRIGIGQKIAPSPHRIAIFASGRGSNAEKIISRFNNAGQNSPIVALVVTNNPSAGIITLARQSGIPVLVVEKDKFDNGYVNELKEAGITFIVLAGFLWKIPAALISAFPRGIINIHPALLPAHGGQGMYGKHVHQAVIDQKEKESGITIHYVDEQYDHGAIIFQARCPVEETDTPGTLAARIQQLEHLHYPAIIASLLKNH